MCVCDFLDSSCLRVLLMVKMRDDLPRQARDKHEETNIRKALKRQNVRHGVELSVVLVRFHLDLVDEFNVRPPDLRALQRLQEHGT